MRRLILTVVACLALAACDDDEAPKSYGDTKVLEKQQPRWRTVDERMMLTLAALLLATPLVFRRWSR